MPCGTLLTGLSLEGLSQASETHVQTLERLAGPSWCLDPVALAAGPQLQVAGASRGRACTPLRQTCMNSSTDLPLLVLTPRTPSARAPEHSHSFIMPMSTQRLSRHAWQWRRLSLVMRQSPLKGQVNSAFRFMLRLPRERAPATCVPPTFQPWPRLPAGAVTTETCLQAPGISMSPTEGLGPNPGHSQ